MSLVQPVWKTSQSVWFVWILDRYLQHNVEPKFNIYFIVPFTQYPIHFYWIYNIPKRHKRPLYCQDGRSRSTPLHRQERLSRADGAISRPDLSFFIRFSRGQSADAQTAEEGNSFIKSVLPIQYVRSDRDKWRSRSPHVRNALPQRLSTEWIPGSRLGNNDLCDSFGSW